MMMNVFALTAEGATEEAMSFADRATEAGIVSLQGMLTIFLVLSILWGAIEIMHYVLVGRKEKKAAKATSDAPVSEATAPEAAPTAPVVPAVADDGAIVAAITAAISAQLAEEGYTGGFRVVSFKRVGATPRRRV